jgi:cell fate (sporulation/competence/biofilm development) regulator YlbF (YheA/YmcA/DUF963 family)
MNPYDKAHELIRVLRNSEQFRRVKEAREKVEGDPQALNMLQDFRKRQWELETKQLTGGDVSQADIDNLNRLAEVVSLHRDVHTYLEAEYQFSMMISDIQRLLGEVVDEAMLPAPFTDTKAKEDK